MTVHELSQGLIERLQSSASVRIVYGDPIETQGKTIIPIARVAFGFGGGLAPGRLRAANEEKARLGEGSGGGVAATPVGVIEITRDDCRFIPASGGKHMMIAAGLGLLIGILLARRV